MLDPPLHLPIVSAPINGQPKKGQKKKPPLPAHNNSLWSVVGAGDTWTSSRPLSSPCNDEWCALVIDRFPINRATRITYVGTSVLITIIHGIRCAIRRICPQCHIPSNLASAHSVVGLILWATQSTTTGIGRRRPAPLRCQLIRFADYACRSRRPCLCVVGTLHSGDLSGCNAQCGG